MELARLQRPDRPATPESMLLLDLPIDAMRTVDTPEFAGMTFLEVTTRSALNKVRGMPFRWSINPYRGCSHACTYCFARPTHTYLNLNATSDFDSVVVVKTNVAEVLAREVARPSWHGEHVALGTNTDPYQRAEGRYRLMPGIIRALAESWTPFSILTKGTLITRDIPALRAAAQRVPVAASLTVGMLNRPLWKSVEPGTPSPRSRLDAVRKLNRAGIPTGVMLAPIMPGLNDDPEQLVELTREAVAAGATHVTPIPLHLRPAVKRAFWPWLRESHPALVDRYAELYGAPDGRGAQRSHPPDAVTEPLMTIVRQARDEAWRERGGPPDAGAWPDRNRPGENESGHHVGTAVRPAPEAQQLSLLG